MGRVFYPSAKNVPVAQRLEFPDVLFVHQPGIGNNNEVLQVVLLHEAFDNGKHGFPFVLVALVDAIRKRIPAQTDEKTQDNLRIAMLPVFGLARYSKFVFIIGFKVQRCHVIEDDAERSSENFLCVPDTDFLDTFLLLRVQFVEISINPIE